MTYTRYVTPVAVCIPGSSFYMSCGISGCGAGEGIFFNRRGKADRERGRVDLGGMRRERDSLKDGHNFHGNGSVRASSGISLHWTG